MDFTQLTENERKVITLLMRNAELSKPQIAELGQMSWATVVKIINRLLDANMIACVGTSNRAVHRGKNSYIYTLTGITPLAIGVDVEYQEITMVLTNLKGTIKLKRTFPTPQTPSIWELQEYLLQILRDFFNECCQLVERTFIKGIGIGLPGVSIPSWLKSADPDINHTELRAYLEEHLNLPVCIENNVRAYTVYAKWNKPVFFSKDFVLLSIRTGVGSGIILDGNLYAGTQNLAGEIGHFTVNPDGPLCRCGKRGCLETYLNQRELYRRLLEISGREDEDFSNEDVKKHLGELFTRAKQGDMSARSVLEELADIFAPQLSHMIMVLNIQDFIINGHFGDDGDYFIALLQERLKRYMLPNVHYRLTYYPFDNQGFLLGAALLILRQYSWYQISK